MTIDSDVGFEGSVFVSGGSNVIGGIGNFDRVVYCFLGMVGAAGFSSSFRSSSSSISSLVEVSILVLVPWFQEAIARVVSYLSAIITGSLLSASLFFLGCYLVELGGVIGRALVMSLVVIPGIFVFRWDYSIRYCIAVLVSVSIKSC